MGIQEFFQNFLFRMDLLSSRAGLRARGEPDYQTLCGGVFSLIIMGAFAGIFYSAFLDTLNRVDITYSSSVADQTDSTDTVSWVQFAVGIDDIDLSAIPALFTVSLKQISISEGAAPGQTNSTGSLVMLEPCSSSDWTSLGDDFERQYTGFGFDSMLCLTGDTAVELYGYLGSMPYKHLQLEVSVCNASTSATSCYNSSEVSSQMSSYLSSNNYYSVRFYIVDTIVSPGEEQPATRFIEKNIMMTFTETTGTVGYVFIGEYEVTTDKSLLPSQLSPDPDVEEGTYLETHSSHTIPISSTASTLVDFTIAKSTRKLSISHDYEKIDDFLSYVGGLFSLLFTFIAFFFASYSQYCYELHVAEHTLAVDGSGRRFKEEQMGFCTYLGYAFYDWLDIFGYNPDAPTLQEIHKVREEANYQLDTVTLLKRVQHLENVSKVLLQEHQLLALKLANPPSIAQAEKHRQALHLNSELHDQLQPTAQFIENASSLSVKADQEAGQEVSVQEEVTQLLEEALRKVRAEQKPTSQRINQLIQPQISKLVLRSNSNEEIVSEPNCSQAEIKPISMQMIYPVQDVQDQ